jgi:uncharacterized protein YggE
MSHRFPFFFCCHYLRLLLLWLLPMLGQAQVSGNQVLGRSHARRYVSSEAESAPALPSNLFLTDSTFLVGANVMQHVRADRYVAVFGLREEAATVAAADKHLSARVQRFTARLRRLDIDAKDVYTDIGTQKRVQDVRASRQAGFSREAYVRGFELTRNVIIPFRRIQVLDEMLVAAATDSIYDLVKVDYIVSDPEAVYASLFKAATEVIARKRANYVALTAAPLRPTAQPYAEVFSSFVPAGQYQAYEATVTTPYTVSGEYNQAFKGLPTLTTFYYSPPSTDGFDRIINPVVTEPVVTYTLGIQVKYTLQKPARR